MAECDCDPQWNVVFEFMALMGNAKFRAYFLGRGYQGEKIVAVLDNEPAVDVLERIVSHQAPVVLAVKTPTAPWGFALRRVESWPTGGEQEVEVVEFAEETSIGMLVAPTGPHQFEVPRESEEPVRLLVA